MTVFFTRSLLNLLLVRTVLNNFYFCSFTLLKVLVRLVFVFLHLKSSCKTNGNNFCFRISFSYENSSGYM